MSNQIIYLLILLIILIIYLIHFNMYRENKRIRAGLSGLLIGFGLSPLFLSLPGLLYGLPLEGYTWERLIMAGIGIFMYIVDSYGSKSPKHK